MNTMHNLSEEGEMVSDLSSDPLIPGPMSYKAFTVMRGAILTARLKLQNKEFSWEIRAFEKEKWTV